MATHESLAPHRKARSSSNRSFGIVFAVVFAVVGLLPAWSGHALRPWALGVAIMFLAIAFMAPHLLAPLNRLWTMLGLVLHHVVNPLVMGLIYYGALVPMGYLLRARGKDLLRLKRDPAATTYWTPRTPPAPAPGSMSKQF